MLMAILEKATTSVTQMDITKAVVIWPVTASAEQIPRTSRAMGLRLNMERDISSNFVSAIRVILSQLSKKRFEAVFAKPEFHKVVDAFGGQGRPR
jgi:hypothetical protein